MEIMDLDAIEEQSMLWTDEFLNEMFCGKGGC